MSENNINESISPDINTNGACPQQEAAAHCAEKAQDKTRLLVLACS